MNKTRVLAWGDYACSTGFGTVMKNIMSELHKSGQYEIDVVGVNYDGGPYDTNKWPDIINSMIYELAKPNHLPPQFSVILRNVPVEKDVTILLNELKEEYPDIVNAFRLTNKSKTPTSIVRLDIGSVEIIEELL